MEEAHPRPALGRIKHVLAEEAQLDAFRNDRFHYTLLDFLQKRRGGGGASGSSGSLSAGGKSGGQQTAIELVHISCQLTLLQDRPQSY